MGFLAFRTRIFSSSGLRCGPQTESVYTNVNGIFGNGNGNDTGQRIRNPIVTATRGRPLVNRIRGRREENRGRRNNIRVDWGRGGGGRCVRLSIQQNAPTLVKYSQGSQASVHPNEESSFNNFDVPQYRHYL